MVTRSKRAPSTPNAMPITEWRLRPRLICDESSVEEGVVGMVVEPISGGDCVGADNGSASALLVDGVAVTMFVFVTAVDLSSIVVVASTSMSFEIVRVTVEATIIEL